MKVEIKEQPQQIERKYPYVGKSDNLIVMFIAKKIGIALNECFYDIGHYYNDWNEEAFTPLPPNSVTITI